MSISNREEANKYYQLINGLVDGYVESHNIRPSSLRRYFKPDGERMQKFLLKNKLSEIPGVKQVLNDVIDDRVSEEIDGVITFETFKYFESEEFKINSMKECLYKAIDKSTISQEKVLADYFDTNLSSIDVVDTHKHRFTLVDWEGGLKHVVIYSEEEVETIKDNFIQHLFEEISKKEIQVGNFQMQLSSLINKDLVFGTLEEKFTKPVITDSICSCLGEDWEFQAVSTGQFIWTKF